MTQAEQSFQGRDDVMAAANASHTRCSGHNACASGVQSAALLL